MGRIFRLCVNSSLPSFSVRNYRVDHVRAVQKVTTCGKLLLGLRVKTVFLEGKMFESIGMRIRRLSGYFSSSSP